MSSYPELLEAVAQYYGSSSDIWYQLATGSQTELTTAEFASAMQQVPGVTTVVNSSGQVLRYEYAATEYLSAGGSAAESAAQLINSNIPSSTTGAGSTALAVRTPVNVATEVQSGETVVTAANSGMAAGGATGLQFITQSVLPAIGAAGVGIALGKMIDSTLYNLNPDFWDANGMSALNPATWGNIAGDDPDGLGRLFNLVFGIDPQTGEAQAYLDENAFAYFAAYMASMGVFNVGIPVATSELYPGYNVHYSGTLTAENERYRWTWSGATFACIGSGDVKAVIALSDRPGVAHLETYYKNSEQAITTNYTLASSMESGKTVYFKAADQINAQYATSPVPTNVPGSDIPYGYSNSILAYIVFYGTSSGGSSVEGFTDQDGATLPDFSGIADLTNIPSVLSALQNQFPALWDDAETNTVISNPETGDTETYTYIPIPMPVNNPTNVNQPTGGGQGTMDQLHPSFDPISMEDIIDSVLDIIESDIEIEVDPETGEEIPITVPPDPAPPNPPDTGDGDTPAVVVPDGSASALFAVYNPTQAQVNSFGAWLWSNDFVDQLKKIFNDPMESVISLHKVFAAPSTGSAQNIYVGYLNSGVSAATVTNQYTEVDCGSVRLLEYFGNVFDYQNTSVELYLPFIGIVPLSVNDVMRGVINVKYTVDVLTGACLAEVSVTRDMAGGVLYQFEGNCAVHYPVSSGSYIGIVGGLLGAIGGVAGTIATGGATAPLLLGAGASIMRAHTDVARSGGFSANSGAMGCKKPYLIISRPQTAVAAGFNTIEGKGANSTVTLSSCSGYVKVKECHLSGINAYDTELDEIKGLLQNGVII